MRIVKQDWKWKCLLTLFIILATAFGCSGGGGGGGGGGGSDTTPPEVSSVAPVDGAADITLDAEISVTFNEAMDAATINAASMTISPSVIGTIAYDTGSNRATFSPTGDLAVSTPYTVTLTVACTDAAGNAMAADYSWSFTTGTTAVNEWTQVGGQVSPSSAESEDPTMMIVSNTPAVGYRQASFEANLHTWNGTTWGTSATDPSSTTITSGSYHAPAFCSNGNTIYLAFSKDDSSYTEILAYEWTTGGGYTVLNGGLEVSIPYNATYLDANAYEAAIGCYDSTLPWVAWEQLDAASSSSDGHAWAAQITGGGTSVSRVGDLSRNNSTGDYSTSVRTVGIIQNSIGCAIMAQWEQHHTDMNRNDLFVSMTCGTGYTGLGGALTDDYDGNELSKPAMAMIGNDIYIAYTRANPTDYTQHVYVQRYNSGAWSMVGSGPVSAHSDTDHYDSGNPDLIVADGTLYVAWEESDNFDGPFIYVARYDTTASDWVVDPAPINAGPGRVSIDPSLAYNPTDGYLYLAFEELVNSTWEIFVKRKLHIP